MAFPIFAVLVAAIAIEEVRYPVSIAVNESGAIYLADRGLPGVWQLDGDLLSLYFRGSKRVGTPLNAIRCLAFDPQGRLLAGDSGTRQVYRFDDQNSPQPVTAMIGGLGQVEVPMDIEVDGDGNLLVSDLDGGRIVLVSAESKEVLLWASLAAPRGLFLDSEDRLWAISGRRLVRFSTSKEAEIVVDNGVFQYPNDVAVDPDGVAYVSDGHGRTIWRIPPGGKPDPWIRGEPLDNPVGMTFFRGKLLVVDPRAGAVFELNSNGEVSRRDFGAPARSPEKKAK